MDKRKRGEVREEKKGAGVAGSERNFKMQRRVRR
jgi:hypothetical protein